MTELTRSYRVSLNTVVEWRKDMCRHCGDCLAGLQTVFDLTKHPWVNVNGASEEEIRKQVLLCPSQALSLG